LQETGVNIYVPFTEAELDKCVKALKKNKSVGADNIMNEYILTGKTGEDFISLFNLCLIHFVYLIGK
jgi:hypothetical protein